MERLGLVADTHAYQAGLPALLTFFKDQGLTHLACLGDCRPEPFRPWLAMDPGNRLYWVYDVFGPQMPEATRDGIALELEGRIFLAHTRALIWTHFNERIRSYGHAARNYRQPLLACHCHTHVPSVTRFTPGSLSAISMAASRSAVPLASVTMVCTNNPLRFSISTWPR